jgi:hypothetical protein
MAEDRYNDVRELIALHRQSFPQDPLATYYEGDVHYYQEKYDAADQAYAVAEGQQPDDDLRDMIRYSRVLCWHKLGKGLEAYDTFEPKQATFAELASLFAAEMQAEELRQLLERHESNFGVTNETREWHVRLRWLAKDYDGAVELLEQYGQKLIEEHPYDTVSLEAIWVRSLVRLERYDDALTIAKASTAREYSDPYFELVVHAAKGDTDRCAELLPQLLDSADGYYSPQTLLDDEDMGPALQSEAFKELREKYLATPPASEETALPRPAHITLF